MCKEILVICPERPDWGLVSKAAELAACFQGEVHVLAFRKESAREAFSYGADRADVLFLGEDFMDDSILARWLRGKICGEWRTGIILAPATIRMRGMMPMLANMLEAGLTADCTELALDGDGRLLQTRPAFGNSLLACIQSIGARQMATVRPGIYRGRKYDKAEGIIRENRLEDTDDRIRQISFEKLSEECSLWQADLILAGGAGIGSKEGFSWLARVAERLGAALGATRMAVNLGYAPYRCQVGQTGIAVHPEIYIAAGISGAVQHLAGIMGAEKIIAVNKDAHAPIFDYADYGIVADWREVMEEMEEILTKGGYPG
nr:electron transfer flavoprotein subunit alpha/FixB family protein [uncultured Acetatifactor sp.]